MDLLATSLVVICSLVKTRLFIADYDWSIPLGYRTLCHLAHERISRELYWNLGCIWKLDADASSPYASLLPMSAFDQYVLSCVPFDRLFADSIRSE